MVVGRADQIRAGQGYCVVGRWGRAGESLRQTERRSGSEWESRGVLLPETEVGTASPDTRVCVLCLTFEDWEDQGLGTGDLGD